MGKYEREKGKRGERDCKKFIEKELGWKLRRSSQHSGRSYDSSDLVPDEDAVTLEYDHIRIEVKFGYAKTNLTARTPRDWVHKLNWECLRAGQVGIVLWKKPYRKWTALWIEDGMLLQTPDVKKRLEMML